MLSNTNTETDYNPMQHFQKWFYEADEKYDEREPNAMALTTIEVDKYPKNRIVLLKKYTWEGFVFYTNYESNKAKAIYLNPKVCLLFNWINSKRVIQILGKAFKIRDNESINYFHSRPRGSQLGAWASQQSQTVASREELEKKLLNVKNKFEDKDIPKPVHWGGFLVKPEQFKFIEKKEKCNSYENYYLQDDFIWLKTETTEEKNND